MKKLGKILLHVLPILLMIALVPLVYNEYVLTVIYIFIISISLKVIHAKKNDIITMLVGFFGMIISEYIFISTGVETFLRHSLLGVMPLWLPFLWAYGFVVIKRAVEILDK